MEFDSDILLYGTMGSVGDEIAAGLREHGLRIAQTGFPQNTFRDEWGYRRGLGKAIALHKPRVVMPVGNALALSRSRDIIPPGVIVAVDEESKIRALDGKVSCSAVAAEAGVRQPVIYGTYDEAVAAMDSGVQIVFKRDISFGGHGVHLPRDRRALDNLIAHQSPGEPYLLEEWIDGEDFSIDTLRWDDFYFGGCYRVLEHKGNGPAIIRESCRNEEIENAARRILESIDFRGVCGMDFRVDRKGQAYFLECNPRFTGGAGAQREVGFDLPFLLWKLASGQRCAPASDIFFREGIRTTAALY